MAAEFREEPEVTFGVPDERLPEVLAALRALGGEWKASRRVYLYLDAPAGTVERVTARRRRAGWALRRSEKRYVERSGELTKLERRAPETIGLDEWCAAVAPRAVVAAAVKDKARLDVSLGTAVVRVSLDRMTPCEFGPDRPREPFRDLEFELKAGDPARLVTAIRTLLPAPLHDLREITETKPARARLASPFTVERGSAPALVAAFDRWDAETAAPTPPDS